MSVGIAQPAWNDDWKHAGDKTEPPEEREVERVCGTCYWWERCPCGCDWGLCDKLNDLTHEDSPKCREWEEA